MNTARIFTIALKDLKPARLFTVVLKPLPLPPVGIMSGLMAFAKSSGMIPWTALLLMSVLAFASWQHRIVQTHGSITSTTVLRKE